jgi:P27 family predicted phage terminase small subunit
MHELHSATDEDWHILPTKLPDLKMTGEADREYRRIGQYLQSIDRVTELDRQALAHYCLQWAHFVSCAQELKGDLTVDGENVIVAHPLLKPALRSARAVFKVAGLFGLTARTRDLEGDHGNRKSRALKKLEGNRRKVGENRLESPSILALADDWDPKDVDPPAWLTKRARGEYERLRASLTAAEMFCPFDRAPISVICTLFEIYCRCYEQIDSLTVAVTDKKGEYVRDVEHPLHKFMGELAEVLTYQWKDYGQTPRFRKVFSGEQKKQETSAPIIFKPRIAK